MITAEKVKELLANAESNSCDVSQTEIKDLCESWLIQNEKLAMIQHAVNAQAEDQGLWSMDVNIGEAYLQQGLRNLHQVIENQDQKAMESILDCASTTGDVPIKPWSKK